MGNLIVDTKKLDESGKDIIALTKELNEEFSALFTRIANMNTRTFEWVGNASEEFIRRTNIEKVQYTKMVNTLNKYGKTLVDAAEEYESYANKIGG